MKIQFVTDSSANLLAMEGAAFASAPLKILVGDQEFVDHKDVDIPQMLQALKQHKGPSSTACPGVQDWLDAFSDADIVYGAAITSGLSGCYASSQVAAQAYVEEHPDRKVFILDSLSTGPELELIMEKFVSLTQQGKDFDTVCQQIRAYSQKTRLLFCLESLDNFAKNGRINPVIAKAVGLLGVRVIGKASDEGTLQPLHKVRGEKKAIAQLVKSLTEEGYRGGKIRISHTGNPEGAQALTEAILVQYPNAQIQVRENRALCSYYAERGGLLMGFETE